MRYIVFSTNFAKHDTIKNIPVFLVSKENIRKTTVKMKEIPVSAVLATATQRIRTHILFFKR